MTFSASRLMVFAITAPQPSRNARVMTLRFVPGGPEPMMNGFGNFNPSTVVARVGMAVSLGIYLRSFSKFRHVNSTQKSKIKIQAPRKFQNPKARTAFFELGIWSFVWILELGI